MNEAGSNEPTGSVFLRVGNDLVEVDSEGWVPRQVRLTSDGRPREAIGPPRTTRFDEEIGYDGPTPLAPPGTTEFDEWWGSRGIAIPREEFESVFAQAKSHGVRFRDYPRADKVTEVRGCLEAIVALLVFIVIASLVLGIVLAIAAAIFGALSG
jgi:hypothetical protein